MSIMSENGSKYVGNHAMNMRTTYSSAGKHGSSATRPDLRGQGQHLITGHTNWHLLCHWVIVICQSHDNRKLFAHAGASTKIGRPLCASNGLVAPFLGLNNSHQGSFNFANNLILLSTSNWNEEWKIIVPSLHNMVFLLHASKYTKQYCMTLCNRGL